MKTLLAIGMVLVAMAAFAQDWQQSLTAQPGAFPPPRPFKATYRFGWSAFSAADGAVSFSKPSVSTFQLDLKAHTTGIVRGMWRLDAEGTSLADAATLHPISLRQREAYKDETLVTKLDFDSNGVARLRERDPPRKEPAKIKHFKFPATYDLHSALLFVRSQPLNQGDQVRFVVYPSADAYLAEVEVLGRQKLKVAGKNFDAIRLGLRLRRIAKNFSLEAHKKFKKAIAWISDDPDRFLLKIEAEVFIGSVWVELEKAEFLPD